MTEAKLLAELMLQLSIYFESDTDDVAEWLCSFNRDLDDAPMRFILKDIEKLHKYVMENMV